MRLPVLLLLLSLVAMPAHATACWDEAGREQNIDPALLYAIAKVESSLNPAAKNMSHVKRTGSYGIGMMQVESVHLPRLRKQNIDERTLLTDECTNIKVGASILAECFQQFGVTWEGVGAYNASCTVLKGEACRRARATYAWKVYRAMYNRGMQASARAPHTRTARPAARAVIIQERLS